MGQNDTPTRGILILALARPVAEGRVLEALVTQEAVY